MKKFSLILIFILLIVNMMAQERTDAETSVKKPQISANERITLARDAYLVTALKTIEVVSLQYEDKSIINTSSLNTPIGFPIRQLYWKDALALIVKLNDLVLEERPGAYIVSDPEIEISEDPVDPEAITADTKQIRISSIFFKVDKTLSKEVGIDWSSLFLGKVNASVNFNSADKVSSDIFSAATTHNINAGNVNIQLDVLLRILEQYQKGTIVARPNITVLSSKQGYIQVGQDFSVKSLDDAGNVTEEFFQTGIILEVTPNILEADGQESIYLVVKVEKSDAIPGDVSTLVNKSKSTTDVVLFDGEETVIGGLYDTARKTSRAGIPVLKDLPWWIFGLRYLFGYNSYDVSTNEMIIILKAEIMDSLDERLKKKKSIKEQIAEKKLEFEKAKSYFDIKTDIDLEEAEEEE
jgi:general secretion pathway protein D